MKLKAAKKLNGNWDKANQSDKAKYENMEDVTSVEIKNTKNQVIYTKHTIISVLPIFDAMGNIRAYKTLGEYS